MRRWVPGICLFCLTCVVYAREPFNGFIWDDPQYVVDNPTLNTAGGLWHIWADPRATPQYYPAVHTTFWVEAQLWGTHNAAGFHIDNVLLHATAAVLLWRALVAIGAPWPWLAAAAFAVHPVTVESVAWVTERKNVLCLTFYLLAFHAYRRTGLLAADEKPRTHIRGSARTWYLLSLFLFLLALLSKTVTCSLPAAFLLVVYWRRGRVAWANVKPLLPFFAVGVGMSFVTAHLERTHVGANGPDFDWITPADRLLIAGRAAWSYAGKVVWPHPLLFMYPRWSVDPTQLWQWAYPAAWAVILTGLWLARRRLGRGPLVAVLFFLGTLVPALGFVNVYPMRYSWVADHFQYLAMIGPIALVVAGLDRLARSPGCTSAGASSACRSALAAAVLVPLAVLTWRQQAIYRDAETLWRDTVTRNPTSWMAHVNLANALRSRGADDAARAESRASLAMAPAEGDTHFDVGYDLAHQHRWAEATAEFRRATELSPQVPATWSTLARILWEHRATPADAAQAAAAARRAVDLDANLPDAQAVLSEYATAVGDTAGAVEHAERAAALEPGNEAAHVRLGGALARARRPADAAAEFHRAVTLDPTDVSAWTNLGYCGLASGHRTDAAAAFRRALAVNPTFAPAAAGLRQATGER